MSTKTQLFSSSMSGLDSQAENIHEAFGGPRVTARVNRNDPTWTRRLAEAEQFLSDIYEGRKPLWQFREAMSTSDFPLLFADSLDRQLYGAYQATPVTWRNYARAATVNDFREVKRFATSGIRGLLHPVKELAEHERRAQTEQEYTYAVQKYEAGFAASWETMINDDLDAFRRLPSDLAQSARDSEEHFVTTLYATASGPRPEVYNTGNDNLLTAPLSRPALQEAITKLMTRKDDNDNPIMVTAVELVVGPALALRAQEIIQASQYRMTDANGNVTIITGNGLGANFRPNTNFWLPAVITDQAAAATSWFLFANPDNSARPALEFGRLRGFEAPALYEKVPNMRRLGGGEEPFDFDTEAMERKVKHVFGGTFVDPKMTIASTGAGGS